MILEGTTSSGAVVPVQVTTDGKVVAEGREGPQGPQGPEGPQGPPGPDSGIWERSGTVVSPTNAGDDITTTGDVNGAGITATGVVSNPAVTLDPGSTGSPLVRDAQGRLLVGTDTARSRFFNSDGDTTTVQIEGSGVTTKGIHHLSIISNNTSNHPGAGAFAVFGRSRGGIGDYTAVASGDAIGSLSFQGADGTDLVEASRITAFADGDPGNDNMPGRLTFLTTPSGSATPVERMRIDSEGDVIFFGAPIVRSPDGSFWKIAVDNSGNLSAYRAV